MTAIQPDDDLVDRQIARFLDVRAEEIARGVTPIPMVVDALAGRLAYRPARVSLRTVAVAAAIIALAIAAALIAVGHDVATTANGHEATAAVRDKGLRPDVVLTDLTTSKKTFSGPP